MPCLQDTDYLIHMLQEQRDDFADAYFGLDDANQVAPDRVPTVTEATKMNDAINNFHAAASALASAGFDVQQDFIMCEFDATACITELDNFIEFLKQNRC